MKRWEDVQDVLSSKWWAANNLQYDLIFRRKIAYMLHKKFGKIPTIKIASKINSGEWDLGEGGERRKFSLLKFYFRAFKSFNNKHILLSWFFSNIGQKIKQFPVPLIRTFIIFLKQIAKVNVKPLKYFFN